MRVRTSMNEQDVDSAQRDRVEGEQVGGQQSGGLSAQEGPPSGVGPAWCWAESSGGQDPANRAGVYAMPETEEFALDPAVAPGGVLPCQAQHQGPDLVINRWAAAPVGIGPVSGDQAAVPGQQRGRSDDSMGPQPAGEQAGQADKIARSGQLRRGRVT